MPAVAALYLLSPRSGSACSYHIFFTIAEVGWCEPVVAAPFLLSLRLIVHVLYHRLFTTPLMN